jgi:hypothetical protein
MNNPLDLRRGLFHLLVKSGKDLTLGYVKTWIKIYNVDWWGIQNGISLHQIGGF